MASKVAHILDTGTNHISIEMPRHPPRLSVALLHAKPGKYYLWQTDLDKELAEDPKKRVDLGQGAFEDELGRILGHIRQRLEIGLDEAWISRWGYDAPGLPDSAGLTQAEAAKKLQETLDRAYALQTLFNEPEEQWSRQFAEMFCYVPYAGIGQAMLNSGKKNWRLLLKWPSVYPVVVACQHLATYGPLTRGFDPKTVAEQPPSPPAMVRVNGEMVPKEYLNGMNASANAGVPIFGKTVPVTDTTRPAWVNTSVIGKWETADLRQGDVISGKDSDPEQKGFAHAATVLRRWPLPKSAAAAENPTVTLQIFDTGVFAALGDTNTQDHGWMTGNSISMAFSQAAADNQGFGRLPEATDLPGAVEKAKKALPLGFARLALLDEGGLVRYVSAMLPMWFGEHRFAMARYLWSIRDLPAEKMVAYWVFYLPVGRALFDELLREVDSPDRTVAEIYAAATGKLKDKESIALQYIAVFTSKPRIIRSVNKTSTDWKDVNANAEGEELLYAEGEEGDKKRADWAAKKYGPKKPAPHSGQASEVKDAANLHGALPFKLNGGPPREKELARPAGWAFLEDTRFLGTELLIVDPDHPDVVTERPMTDNKAAYFNGPPPPPPMREIPDVTNPDARYIA